MNNKPRYTPGSVRYEITNLLHIALVLTPRSFKLLGIDWNQICNCLTRMKKERVVEKGHGSEVFTCINTKVYEQSMLPYLVESINKSDLDYFNLYASQDINKAKYIRKKARGDSERVLRNGEIITLMHTAGIATYPSERESVTHGNQILNNIFYMARDLKDSTDYDASVVESNGEKEVFFSKMNGVVGTRGGNYAVYHFGKKLRPTPPVGELKLKVLVENLLSRYTGVCNFPMIENAILIGHTLEVFGKAIEGDLKQEKIINDFSNMFSNVYALPYDENGRDMLKVMCIEDWKRKLIEYCTEEKMQDTSKEHIVCDLCEGDVYSLVFCVSDVSRLISFMEVAKMHNDKSKYQIFCFDYQAEFVKKYCGEYAEILIGSLSDLLEEWKIR